MSETILDKLNYFIKIGENVDNEHQYDAWVGRVHSFLKIATDDDSEGDFTRFHPDNWVDILPMQLGHIEGMIARLAAKQIAVKAENTSIDNSDTAEKVEPYMLRKSSRVFIVHGHDIETKESVARFIQKIGLDPIILHEQASSGRTIIEKFEVYSDVGFAIVLLTPDDVGASQSDSGNLNSRARQNVILELGYFMGKLSRQRVCALFKEGIEIPSDYQGVLYIEFDDKGAWRAKLAQELVQAGMKINLEELLKS